jgi:hypothetical protein
MVRSDPIIDFILLEHPSTSNTVAWHSSLLNPLVDSLIADVPKLANVINRYPSVFHVYTLNRLGFVIVNEVMPQYG